MSGYVIRALEVHDFARIWNLSEMRRRIRFAAENRLNALVLHEPGIVDKIVYPASFLGGRSSGANFFELSQKIEANIFRFATREFLNAFRHKYLVQLIDEAAEAGVTVYLEDKELWFKDFVLRVHPEVFQHGVFCPSRSFWWEEFLPAKYAELFIALPRLAGVVTSFGTGESRLAIGNLEQCGCDCCRSLSPAQWYRNMALGMHRPFRDAGKKLVIRDFVFQREEHGQFARSLNELPADIAVSLKNTPHDFYPTFPDNPLIGRVGAREQWIEYDVHGQYFGWGVAPSIMIDDLSHRLEYARRRGATGFILRTDWEGLQDHSCFDTLNGLNLYAAAALAEDPAVGKRRIYERWLAGERLLREPLSPEELRRCVDWAINLLEPTWPVVKDALFVNGTVFSDSSAFHVDLGQSTWIAETLHSLKDWSADAGDALRMQDRNARKILAEKDGALAGAEALLERAQAGDPALRPEVYAKIVQSFEFLRWYAEGFRLTARVYVFSRLLDQRGGRRPFFMDEPPGSLLKSAIAELRAYRKRLAGSPFAGVYPANVLLDSGRLDCFLKDAERSLREHGG
jgi:hypothetical protein